MSIYTDVVAPRADKQRTPQNQPIPGREAEMARNNAGGFTFTLDKWGQFDRFLILGSDTPTYYQGARELTKENAKNVFDCIKEDGQRAVARIFDISVTGRAPKNDPAVFALAIAAVHGDAETVKAAYGALSRVCRTGTHLFQFVEALDRMGKWNAAAKRGVAQWYTGKKDDRLAVQLLKYQSRNGWSHRDVLRLAHVKPLTDVQSGAFRYAVKGAEGMEKGQAVPQLVVDFERLKKADAKAAISIIEQNKDVTWEMIPTELQRDADVWLALLPNMGLTAMIRKLGQLTNVGVIKALSEGTKLVVSKLQDAEAIKAARVHPVTLLSALAQYRQGKGLKGSLVWSPDQRVLSALNDAFYDAFNYIESTGESYLLGVDCSGSMFGATVSGAPGLTAAEVATVMALAVAKREPNHWIGGFNTQMGELKISPSMRLDQALSVVRNFSWGGTDCALPMLHASKHKMNVDKFVVITDNETWAGRTQPVQALRDYRKEFKRDSKLIVCGTSSTNFTIADPRDPGMLDVVGFDSNVPQLIQQF
jgi:60 kDa SS-A/Ro ribonucleoprotein